MKNLFFGCTAVEKETSTDSAKIIQMLLKDLWSVQYYVNYYATIF